MTIQNPLVAVMTFLKADAGVSALVGTRVYGIEVPESELKNWATQARHTVVVLPDGQPSFGPGVDDNLQLQTNFFDFRSYGATMFEAMTLQLAVREALKNLDRSIQSQTLIHSAKPLGGPSPLRDADRDWPFMLESFTVLASECQAI